MPDKSRSFRFCHQYHGRSNFSFFLFLASFSSLFLSCEKNISLDLPTVSTQICIDAWINEGEPVNAILTLSSPFFSKYDSLTLRHAVVTYAKLSLSDGQTSEILNLEKNNAFFPPYVYRSQLIKGKIGGKYTLSVLADGSEHVSSAEMKPAVKISKLWSKKAGGKDTLERVICLQIKDKALERNYYRIYTKILHQESVFVPIISSVWSDNFFDGMDYTFTLQRGFEDFSHQNHGLYYSVGDTVVVKLCAIDERSFTFWYTIEQQLYNSNNPLAGASDRVVSNFTGDALGVFSAYASSFDTLVVK